MKSLLTIIFIVMLSTNLFAQENKDTTKVSKWTPKGVTGLNLSQVALSNWTQGGESTVTWAIFGDFGFEYKSEQWKLSNNMKLNYGMTKLGDKDFRTASNDFFFENVLSYNVGWFVDPYISNSVRTVLDKGYEYNDTSKIQTSAFFDPGYVTQSIGFAFSNSKIITTRLGAAFQETFASKFTKFTDDPDTKKIEDFKFETGVESVTEFNHNWAENLNQTSKLRLFSRFERLDVWDVRWENTLTAKVTTLINVNFNFLLIYEKDQSIKTQIREALQLGFAYNIF